MTDAEIPILLRSPGAAVDLVVRAPAAARWGEVGPLVCRAAGLAADSPLYLGAAPLDPEQPLGLPPLLAGAALQTWPVAGPPIAGALVLDCIAGPTAGGSVALEDDPVRIGRAPDADLVLADPEVSARHAVVGGAAAAGFPDRTGIVIADLLSTNGTRVGDRDCGPGHPVPLAVGEIAALGASRVRLDLPAVVPMLRHPDGAGHWVLTLPAAAPSGFARQLPPDPGPPPVRQRRPLPVIASLAGAVAGVSIALLTGMWMFLLMAALGPITMLATGLGDRVAGRRSHRRMTAEHAATLAAYTAALADGLAAERADRWERFADPARLLRWARDGGTRLWERRMPTAVAEPTKTEPTAGAAPTGSADGGPDPPSFDVVLEIGSGPSRLPGAGPTELHDVPLPSPLPRSGVLGICGGRRGGLRWLLAQLIGLFPPSVLALQVLSAADDLSVLRDVPHAGRPDGPGRVHRDPATLLAALARSDDDNRLTVVLIDGVERLRHDDSVAELLRRNDDRLLVIVVARTRTGLPAACRQVLDLDRAAGDPVGVGPGYLAELAGALAPLTVSASGAGLLPRQVCGPVPSPATLAANWQRGSRPRFVLGVGPAGALGLDLAADGPHLLIAGTTGAGKSELLQTLIAGLATELPPQQLALLLVDYKGGAAFAEAARLPHTSGLVTDLDPRLAARALSSLRAEIRRRERVLADAGVAELTGLPAADAPPRLVIVVDEFATLAAELPDFLSGLVDIAQRGRSLGLHLVLATQRPTGVVSPAILANTSARICLRVADPADAMAVLDSPAPARVPAQLPGRGLLRTGGGRPVPFQALQVTAPSTDRVQVWRRDRPPPPAAGPVPLTRLIDLATTAAAGTRLPPPPWLPPLPRLLEHPDPAVLGMLDLPDEQLQRPWPLPTGSLLVHGPAGSGRTGVARRWTRAVAAAGGRLLLVDPGRALTDLGTRTPGNQAPGTGPTLVDSYLDGTEPALVLRLLTVLTDELNERVGGTGGGWPVLGLAIDGFEALAAALDAIDYGQWQSTLGELVGRGPSVGIRVLVTGGPRLAQHRLAASFTEVLALATAAAGGEPVAGLPPGRGRLAGAAAGELQVAVAPAGAPIDRLTVPAPAPLPAPEPMQEPAPIRAPARWVIRPLPTTVPIDVLPTARPAAVPIGVGGDAAGPLTVDLTGAGGALLLAGRRRSGVSNTLAVLGGRAAAAGIRVVRATLRPAEPVPGVADLDLRGGAAPLVTLLAGHQGRLLLLADDADRFADHPAGEVLVRFLTVAGAGQYLALGVRLDLAARSHRGLVAEAAAFRTGVLLGADAVDGTVLETALPRRRVPAAPGRGHWVLAGHPTEVQIASPAGRPAV
ncbi:FtsK/SpoIIIE domain-containing protein [Nakamurella lactea]|uniref:FtsK/SpoIIIE domain-containing protein n=1 Tax=Nakamurella lactea TaxID=459515 RepID=UPI0003FAE5BA|nr:FtsK/SpoIIIE domain-containing protein [Nakamurella lactea]